MSPKLAVGLGLLAVSLAGAQPAKPLLRTALEVHRLSPEAASHALPVHLRGIVTYMMPEWKGFSFQDKSDALYVSASSIPAVPLTIGQMVEVSGKTAPGNFAPLVDAEQVRVVGTGRMPAPRHADWKYISSGACDNDYVQIEGVVRSVGIVDPPYWRWHATALHIDVGGNLVWAYIRDTRGLSVTQLPDSNVRLSGVCLVLANSRRQFEQNALLIGRATDIEILKPAGDDPFSTPWTTIDRLFQYSPTLSGLHRVRVRGTVVLKEPRRVFIQDKNNGLLVRTTSTAAVELGDVVDAVGFPAPGTYSTLLDDSAVRRSGQRAEISPLVIEADEVMSRVRDRRPALPDAMLLLVEGIVLDVSRTAREETLVVQDGATIYTARVARSRPWRELPSVEEGSRIAVTGVCVIQVGDMGAPRSFELLMRSPADIRVLTNPSWLTLPLALRALALLFAIMAGVALWGALLRKRVRAQTTLIRQQMERESMLGERFRDMVEYASDMVYVRDLEGRLLHVNRGMMHLTGYSREELLALNFIDLLAPEQREKARRQLAVNDAAEPSPLEETEWQFLRKDGRAITVEVKQRFLPADGQGPRVESIGRDVTERKREMVQNQERFRTLADNIAQLTWMADEKGFPFWYNQRWFEYTGASLDELRGSGWQKWPHPDHLERVVTRLQQSIRSGEPWEDIFLLRGADGEYRWFLGRAVPIHDKSGQVVRWFGTNTDITDQKQIETELQRSNDELRQFAYVASHDLQEPLRNVSIFAELLERSFSPPELTTDRSQYLSIITAGAKRMSALITDLLTYSRLTGGQQSRQHRTDFGLVFDKTLDNLSAALNESGAVITRSALPTIRASESQMSQVFQNLIGNSIKYRRTEVPLQIHVSATQQAGRWLFSVQDNGVGFDPKYAHNVFGVFKRLHGSEIPGTGIGLAICKTIIERHGGSMWAEACPRKGATFYFTIPADG